MTIRLAGYILESIVDGPGIRFVIFTQGCLHHCPGCHNPNTHPLEKGRLVEITDILELIKQNPLIQGLTISGGEPFLQTEAVLNLITEYQKSYPNQSVLVYTGYCFEELLKKEDKNILDILNKIDLLIDGRYNEKERDLTLFYRGSKNQRIIDVPASLKSGVVVLSKYQTMKS